MKTYKSSSKDIIQVSLSSTRSNLQGLLRQFAVSHSKHAQSYYLWQSNQVREIIHFISEWTEKALKIVGVMCLLNLPKLMSYEIFKNKRYFRFHNSWQQAFSKITGKSCIKSVRIRSYSGLYFLTFGLNTKRCEVWENADQNNSKYRNFSRCETRKVIVYPSCLTSEAIHSWNHLTR